MLQFSIKISYILPCILNQNFKSHSQQSNDSYCIHAAYCIETQQSNDSYCILHLILKWCHSFQARASRYLKKVVNHQFDSSARESNQSSSVFLWFDLIFEPNHRFVLIFFGLIRSACTPSLSSLYS